MSIGAIGAGISTLFQVLQQVTQPQPQPAPTPDPNTADAATQPTAGLHPHRHHGPLQKKIQAAVTAALNDPANASADPNKVIQQAIAGILTAKDQQTSSPTPPPSDADDATQQSQFSALLQSVGVSADQFQRDFHAAVVDAKTTNGGNVDFAKLLAKFPPGTSLDTLA